MYVETEDEQANTEKIYQIYGQLASKKRDIKVLGELPKRLYGKLVQQCVLLSTINELLLI